MVPEYTIVGWAAGGIVIENVGGVSESGLKELAVWVGAVSVLTVNADCVG